MRSRWITKVLKQSQTEYLQPTPCLLRDFARIAPELRYRTVESHHQSANDTIRSRWRADDEPTAGADRDAHQCADCHTQRDSRADPAARRDAEAALRDGA
jgi:hypothetical protein